MNIVRIPIRIEVVKAPPLPDIPLTGWRAWLIRRVAAILFILFEP